MQLPVLDVNMDDILTEIKYDLDLHSYLILIAVASIVVRYL